MRKSLFGVILLIVLAVLVYRIKFMPVSVSVTPVVKGTVVQEVVGTGTLQARVRATISAKISGRLVETLVDQNDLVESGQLMARLDDAELVQSVEIAEASLNAAQATVDRVQADQSRGKAVFEQARKDHDRYLALRASKSVSESDVDKSIERLAIAEADLARSGAAIVEAERQMMTARSRLHFEQARLADTKIIAPFAGLVVKRDREPGDVIVPGSSIFQVISLAEMWVSAWVDESAMADIRPVESARILFRSEPAKEYRGTVVRLGREVDTETREFLVDIHVADLPANWAVGQRAETYIEVSRKSDVLVVPLTAIFWQDGRPVAFVIKDGRATKRDLHLGVKGIREVEVKSGLSEGEAVVVSGLGMDLPDGKRVIVQ